MKAAKQNFWMIRPKSLIRLVGAEFDLLQKAGGNVLAKFYLSAAICAIIAVISFLSIRYAIELLFQITFVELFLSIFLSALFFLMYVFLINTFTQDAKVAKLFSVTNIIRTGFVVFIGFLISKPIEIYVFKTRLDISVQAHKHQLTDAHLQKVNQLFYNDREKLRQKRTMYLKTNAMGIFNGQVSKLELEIAAIDAKQDLLSNLSRVKITRGGFFIYRIRQVTGYFSAWIICICVIGLFLLPGYLVYSLTKQDNYFRLKKKYEEDMVLKAYKSFTEKYTSIFYDLYGLSVSFYSKYADPPFNTKVKQEPNYHTAQDFYSKYCNPS